MNVGENVEGARHLDQVALVVAVERIELAGSHEAQQAQLPRPTDIGLDEWGEDLDDARPLDQLARQIQLGTAGGAAATGVQRCSH